MKTDTSVTIEELKKIMFKFSQEREWDRHYAPSILAKSIIIEAAELLELFQWEDSIGSIEKMSKKREVAFEMVDILYYLLMLAKIMRIDVVSNFFLKLKELEKKYPKKTYEKN